MSEIWIVVGYLKEVLCAVGRMESYVGSVLKVLQSLDARISGLEQNNRQLGGFISGKRMRDDVDIWKLWEFLTEKSTGHSLGLNIYQPKLCRVLYESTNDAILISPYARHIRDASSCYIQVVDLKFRIYVLPHINDMVPQDPSAKRMVDESITEFQSKHNYEDIASVWNELKRMYGLDPSW